MLHPHGLDGSSDPPPGDRVRNGFGGDHPLTGASAEQNPLDYVARGLAIGATRPAVGAVFKPSPLPPVRVAARQVTGGFERSRDGLADSIRRHEQALFVRGSGCEELQVFLIELPSQRSGIREQRDESRTAASQFSLYHAGV